MSGALSFAAAAGDASMSSDSGAQGGLVFPGLHGTETGRVLDWLPPQASAQKAARPHTFLSTCWYWLNLRGRLQRQQTPRGYKSALSEHGLGDASFALSLCLNAAHSQKEAYTFLWSPDFCRCCQGRAPDLLTLVASRA